MYNVTLFLGEQYLRHKKNISFYFRSVKNTFFLTCRRASMEDFLEFDEYEREQDVLQKRLVFEKNVLILPVVPHISHTTVKTYKTLINFCSSAITYFDPQ